MVTAKIKNILQKTGILLDYKPSNKRAALQEMGNFITKLYNLKPREFIVQKILDREAEMSTGIGYGIAIPHARIPGIEKLYMIVSRVSESIEFEAIDEKPVYLIFLLISPANTSTDHTRILSSLSRIVSYEEVRKELLKAEDAQEFLDVLIQGEDKYVK
ncbi:MAG: hypothetical protein GF401_04410 [Chitinivibrionales bacterium]|nr:hypothetical protein [Chitinivibrionales bacterium]